MWKSVLKWIRALWSWTLVGLVILTFYLVGAVIALPGAIMELVHYGVIDPKDWRPRPPLETELRATLKALDANSNDAMNLIEKLRSEVADRTAAIHEHEGRLAELQRQHSLLQLTPEQRTALESIAARPTTLRSVLRSWEFITGIVVNIVAGLLVSAIVGRYFYLKGVRTGAAGAA